VVVEYVRWVIFSPSKILLDERKSGMARPIR
jgi:hypothetical protein